MLLNVKSINAAEGDLQDASLSKAISVRYTQAELNEMENKEVLNPKTLYSLGFISETFTPTQKFDVKLQTKIQEFSSTTYEGKNYTYGFIMILGRITPEKLQTLENYSVKLLDYHSGHSYKAKIPLDGADEIKDLSFIKWMGYSTLKQKLHPNLFDKVNIINDEIFINNNYSNEEIPVYINLFEGDTNGEFKTTLEQLGVNISEYNKDLFSYRAYLTPEIIRDVISLDFVLFVEGLSKTILLHDQSMPSISADYIRSSYNGSGILMGIIDSGLESDHPDLPSVSTCNDYSDDNDCEEDNCGHGSHVSGTIFGNGSVNSKYRGVAPGITNITMAKVVEDDCSVPTAHFETAISWIGDLASQPDIVSISVGTEEIYCKGTEQGSRNADSNVYNDEQILIVAAGNEGPTNGTLLSPGCAKNVITVGNVLDYGEGTIDTIHSTSSRGPAEDGCPGDCSLRKKPDVVAPGSIITSVRWNSSLSCNQDCTCTGEYMHCSGTSMATPHVSGLVATLLEHYGWLKGNASAVKALLTATALVYEGDTSNVGDTYGHGKVDSYLSHWIRDNSNGWTWGLINGEVNATTWSYYDITVPGDADRLVVILTWTEPAASAGADYAVINDLDLYLDKGADEPGCTDGENASVLFHDNKEYIYLDNPGADTFRLKFCPLIINETASPQKFDATYMIIRGDPTPLTTLTSSANDTSVYIDELFTVNATVEPDSYMASGVYTKIEVPSGINIISMSTTREDGVTMTYISDNDDINLGDIYEGDTRTVTWTLEATTNGTKTINTSINSDNGGTDIDSVTITANLLPDGYSCSSDSDCQSNLCDNDGVGWSDDGWCFSVESTYYDNQDNKCEESARAANDNWCDEKRDEDLSTCDKTGISYFQDTCSDICAISDTNICRSSVFASGCTANEVCNGIEAGTNGCNSSCQNDNPTNSTIVYPNGGEAVSGYVIINWSESTDPEGYNIRYFLDYSNDSGATWYNLISNYGYESKLNDSSTEKTINFSGNENQTVYLRIPKNAVVTSATLGIEGIA